MEGLYELKDMLCNELEKYGKKGELTAGSLDIVDKLAHATKNLDKIIEKYEERDGGYSQRGDYPIRSYRGGAYARGRGENARRDSMGRYSSEGYSRHDGREDMIAQLEDLKHDAPNKSIMNRIDQLIGELENA